MSNLGVLYLHRETPDVQFVVSVDLYLLHLNLRSPDILYPLCPFSPVTVTALMIAWASRNCRIYSVTNGLGN